MSTFVGSYRKQGIPQKHLLLLYWLPKSFVWITINWKILKETVIPDTLPVSWEMCAAQIATVRTKHGTKYCFRIGKGVLQSCILSLCLFNSYVVYILWNAGLDESQAGIKIARRNIINPRYVDDATLMAESEGELKSSLMRVKKESEKAGFKLNIQNLTSWHLVSSFHGK